MPIIHNESFDEADPFQLRRHGFYDMEGGPDVVVEDGTPSFLSDKRIHFCQERATEPGEPEILLPAAEPSLAHFVAYWTPERRAQRVAEELHEYVAECTGHECIHIPEDATAILYVKGRRGNYNAVAVPTFDQFKDSAVHYIKMMVDCIESDTLAPCGLCDLVFEAHEMEDISARDQRTKHYTAVHRRPSEAIS